MVSQYRIRIAAVVATTQSLKQTLYGGAQVLRIRDADRTNGVLSTVVDAS